MEQKRKLRVTRMRAERLRRKLTLQQVADAIGAKKTTMKDYELLLRTPSLRKYRALQEFYNIKDEDLLEVIEIELDNVFPSIKSL